MGILSYAPAYLVQLIASVVAIYAFTRILPPDQYGLYALTMSLMAPCQSFLFSWSDLGLKRFFGRAEGDGKLPVLAVTIYAGLAATALMLLAACVVAHSTVPMSTQLAVLLWLGAATLIARQSSTVSKTFQLLELARGRFTLMECLESGLGTAAGLLACTWLGMGPGGIFSGMLLGAGAVLLWDSRRILDRLRGGSFDRRLQYQILAFAAPVAVVFFTEYIIASADRLLVEFYLGTTAVGIYAVSYNLAERAVTAPFMAVGLAAYPAIMRAHEQGGPVAVRRHATESAEILLAMALPAWGGFTVASGHIAAVLVGRAYADAAATLMPLTALGIVLLGLRIHYVNYALHLANRTQMALVSSLPGAVLNLVLNVLLLPRIGLIGAVWATVAAYALALVISIGQSIRYYPLPFPFWVAVKAGTATLLMCAVLRVLAFPLSAAGLVMMIACGFLVYAVLAFAFDIAGVRSRGLARLAARGIRKV